MKYNIFYNTNIEELEATIRKYIKKGWVPKGGVSSLIIPGKKPRVMQAMVKQG